jgi:hypothetical protein
MLFLQLLLINWEPKHIEFEAKNTNGDVMIMELKKLHDKFSITQRVRAYVKDKGSNL